MDRRALYTFQKFSRETWVQPRTRGPGHDCVPDEIYAPLIDVLREQASCILPYTRLSAGVSLALGRNRTWEWQETLDLVQSVWDRVGGDYSDKMREAIDSASFRSSDVAYGTGSGQCFTDMVDIESDKSLNDPVCAAHESGHLMAGYLMAPVDSEQPAANLLEIQGMFAQEIAYDLLAEQAADDHERLSVRTHRLSYYTGILSRIPLFLWSLDRDDDAPLSMQDLTAEFKRWSLDEDDISFISRNDNGRIVQSQDLHKHPFAALIVIPLYERYAAADETVRAEMMKSLYQGHCETTLVDVLHAFGAETLEDVRALGERTCARLRDELSQCRFNRGAGPRLHPDSRVS